MHTPILSFNFCGDQMRLNTRHHVQQSWRHQWGSVWLGLSNKTTALTFGFRRYSNISLLSESHICLTYPSTPATSLHKHSCSTSLDVFFSTTFARVVDMLSLHNKSTAWYWHIKIRLQQSKTQRYSAYHHMKQVMQQILTTDKLKQQNVWNFWLEKD